MYCPNCGQRAGEGANFCASCGASLSIQEPSSPKRNRTTAAARAASVQAPSVTIQLKFIDEELELNSIQEAKQAIVLFRQKKKEYALEKRNVTSQQQQIRAEYIDSVRRKDSKFRGGGGVGKFIRAVQTSSRDADRKNLAKALEPLERRKAEIDNQMARLDYDILQVQDYINRSSLP